MSSKVIGSIILISVIVLFSSVRFARGNSIPESAPTQKEYIVYTSTRTSFWGAWRICHSRGQRMATVMSAADSLQLQYAIDLRGNGGNEYWIGATDEGAEGNWIWISTGVDIDHETGYTNWYEDQPDNKDIENCVQVGYTGGVTWNDRPCSTVLGVICERDRSDAALSETTAD